MNASRMIARIDGEAIYASDHSGTDRDRAAASASLVAVDSMRDQTAQGAGLIGKDLSIALFRSTNRQLPQRIVKHRGAAINKVFHCISGRIEIDGQADCGSQGRERNHHYAN